MQLDAVICCSILLSDTVLLPDLNVSVADLNVCLPTSERTWGAGGGGGLVLSPFDTARVLLLLVRALPVIVVGGWVGG